MAQFFRKRRRRTQRKADHACLPPNIIHKNTKQKREQHPTMPKVDWMKIRVARSIPPSSFFPNSLRPTRSMGNNKYRSMGFMRKTLCTAGYKSLLGERRDAFVHAHLAQSFRPRFFRPTPKTEAAATSANRVKYKKINSSQKIGGERVGGVNVVR